MFLNIQSHYMVRVVVATIYVTMELYFANLAKVPPYVLYPNDFYPQWILETEISLAEMQRGVFSHR